MSDPNDPCLACEIVRGAVRPPGGDVVRTGRLLVHGFALASPIPGWLVLTSTRHARALYDLDQDEASEVGSLAARVMRAQRDALGAEHVYAIALGDQLRHFHLHLVPRFAETPERLRGRGAFDARPEDARAVEEIEAAAAKVSRALAGRGA